MYKIYNHENNYLITKKQQIKKNMLKLRIKEKEK